MGEPEPAPSDWLVRHAAALERAARLGPAIDVACGRGRNALAAARRGVRVIGVDRDAAALGTLRDAARREGLPVSPVRADLEAGVGLPVRAGSCGAVLVFRFLFRPLARDLAATLRPGGLLLYETFTRVQRDLPRGPRNPSFLLREGELPELFADLELVAYEETRLESPWPRVLARLAARRPE